MLHYYVLNTLGKAQFHELFKILYFADQEHIKIYGRPITGDKYIAMKYGPVPSFLYDILKDINQSAYHTLFEVSGPERMAEPKAICDKEQLSDTPNCQLKKLASRSGLNVNKNDLKGETKITNEHVKNNTDVRTLLGKSRIKPEQIPPEEDIKKLVRRVKSADKEIIKKKLKGKSL